MTTLKWIDLRCPVCESVFESMAASSNDEDGQALDSFGEFDEDERPWPTGPADRA